MPATEPMMQPISAPILVPGTQQEPTVPTIPLDNHTNGSDVGSTSSGSGHGAAAPALARTSLSGGNHHQKGNISINQHHHYNAHNPNSGLRRFPRIGNTKKLTIENTTLKAKSRGTGAVPDGVQDSGMRQSKELEQEMSVQEGASDEQRDREDKEESENGVIAKDRKIAELLEKVDRFGTEVLILEREKARLQQLPTLPAEGTPSDVASGVACSIATAATLKDLVPIAAEAKIAAATPHSPIRNLAAGSPGGHVSTSDSHTRLNTDNSSWNATQINQDHDNFSQGGEHISTSINSASYDLAQEHSKLLAKYQALRMQHAQASVYVEELEIEIRELKVQSLDVNSGQDSTAH
ncbi:hypothetical protein BGX34_002722 [Mortierella sp. NVP85]|nr:hypothetical protein BGX34_002722 [Mortierella sp. NVP85]